MDAKLKTVRLGDNFEVLPVIRKPLKYARTASGYGSRIPTDYMIHLRGRWRRVYCMIFSNTGTLYLKGRNGKKTTVDIY